MKKFKSKEKIRFAEMFCKSSGIEELKRIVIRFIGSSETRCLFVDKECLPVSGKAKRHREVLALIKDKRPEDIMLFECSCKRPCMAIPVIQGDRLYAYILAFHLKRYPNDKDRIYIKSFLAVALKEFQKEQELKRLYDTIRPRAIALSTIHTVHRLLSSCLNINEVIERIARLSLQVMRARYCSIMLVDESKKYLISKATVDLDSPEKNKIQKKLRMGRGLAGRITQTGRSHISKNILGVPLIEEDVIGVILLKRKASREPFNNFDLEILSTLAEQAVIAIRNAQLYEEQEKAAFGSIKSLSALLDAKSPNMYTHSERFVKIVLAIAQEMKLSREEIRSLHYAALLPDTGKFGIPDKILKKKGKLSRKEYGIIKRQHMESLKILEPLEFLKPVIPIIMHHHERYDGTGYPDGLKNGQIPMGARIMAVAEAFEAMIASRPYKKRGATITQALKEIERNKETQFDPKVVSAFMSALKKLNLRELFYDILIKK